MSDTQTSDRSDNQRKPKPTKRGGRFPKKMLGLSVFVTLVILLSRIFISEFADITGLPPDNLTVLSYGLILLLLLAWTLWAAFLSGRGILFRVIMVVAIIGVPYGFITVLRPIINGDAGISRFEPIWKTKRLVDADVELSSRPVDLKTETPNDFVQFLGNDRNGIVSGQANLPDDAVAQAQVVWKHEIGEGWSGFAARNGYAVTMEQRGEFECVTCYEIQSGQLQWLYKHPARHRDAMGLGRVGPRATPTIDNGKVYANGAIGNFVCLDGATGKLLWQEDLLEILDIDTLPGEADKLQYRYENSTLAWGRAGSPLIVDDLVVVPGGGPRPAQTTDGDRIDNSKMATLIAFDKVTGEQRWLAGTDMIAYGSPSLVTLAGRRQIVIVAESNALGFDANTGEQLWSHRRPGSSEGEANCSQVTPVSDNTILLTKGYRLGGELVRVGYDDGNYSTTTLDSNFRSLNTKLTSPIVFEGHAYSLSDGFLECTEVPSLERIWKHRGRLGHGQMLLCGDKLLVHSESGTLYLVPATPNGYKELGELKTIEGVCWNTICRYGEYLLVRSELEAACIRLKTE